MTTVESIRDEAPGLTNEQLRELLEMANDMASSQEVKQNHPTTRLPTRNCK